MVTPILIIIAIIDVRNFNCLNVHVAFALWQPAGYYEHSHQVLHSYYQKCQWTLVVKSEPLLMRTFMGCSCIMQSQYFPNRTMALCGDIIFLPDSI